MALLFLPLWALSEVAYRLVEQPLIRLGHPINASKPDSIQSETAKP